MTEERRDRGYGHSVMEQLGSFLAPRFDLGAVCASGRAQRFYRRLGWQLWRGPTAVMVEGAALPTPREDGKVMGLETPTTGPLNLEATLACDWRAGDVW